MTGSIITIISKKPLRDLAGCDIAEITISPKRKRDNVLICKGVVGAILSKGETRGLSFYIIRTKAIPRKKYMQVRP